MSGGINLPVGPMYVNRAVSVSPNTSNVKDLTNDATTSLTNALSYAWSTWEDGGVFSSSTIANPIVIFNTVGKHNIYVTVSGEDSTGRLFRGTFSTTTNIVLPAATSTEQ